MKRIFGKIHLIIGFVAGIIFFIVATTGCLTSFEEEIRSSFYDDLFKVKKITRTPINIDEIRSLVIKSNPKDDIRGFRVWKDKQRSVEIFLDKRKSIFVDQYSGKVLGSLVKSDDFFGKVLRLHKNLFLDEVGEWVIRISALLFFIMIISGIIIWWPRDKRARKDKITFKWNVHPVKRNYDLHSVLGFYAAWIILCTVLTALIFSFEWAENSMFYLTGSRKEKRMEVLSIVEYSNKPAPLTRILSQAQVIFPAQEEIIINLSETREESVRAVVRYGRGGFFRKQDYVFFDQYDGKLLKTKKFDSLSSGMKIRISCEKIHTGKAFGVVGQWAVFFASLICASLPITGFLVWWNKRKVKSIARY